MLTEGKVKICLKSKSVAKGSCWVKEVLNYFLTKSFLYFNVNGMISVKQKRLSIKQRKH